jgi:hypothetical protein
VSLNSRCRDRVRAVSLGTAGVGAGGGGADATFGATCAAQRVNASLQPSLVAVDFNEPNEFVTEILGQARFEQISQHKNVDFKSVARITEDPPPEAKPLQYRSFLHAAQRAQLAEARAAKPEPRSRRARAAAMGGPSEARKATVQSL